MWILDVEEFKSPSESSFRKKKLRRRVNRKCRAATLFDVCAIIIFCIPWSFTVNWTRSPSRAVRLGTRPSTNIGGCRYESLAGFVSNTLSSVEHLVMPDSLRATHVYTPASAGPKSDIHSLAASPSRSVVTLFPLGFTSPSSLFVQKLRSLEYTRETNLSINIKSCPTNKMYPFSVLF